MVVSELAFWPKTSVTLLAATLGICSGFAYAVERFDRGTLSLDLTGPREFRWVPNNGDTTVVQPIVERRCEIDWFGSPRPLVELTTAAGVSPGFVDYLGAYGGGKGNSGRGTPCGQINPGQDLTVALTGDLAGLVVKFSEIDLQLKGSPEATITTSLEGATTGVYLVRAGSAIVSGEGRNARTAEYSPADPIPESEDPSGFISAVINCANLADSGPDSGDRDNCRIAFNAPWDSMSISTSGGDVALGGGGDGGFTGASEFQLSEEFDGILDCNDTVTVIGEAGSFGELRRLPFNPEECGECVAIPYNLTFGNNELSFVADYLQDTETPQTCAAFAFTVNFGVVDLADPPIRPVPGNVEVLDPDFPDQGNFPFTVTGQNPLAIVQQFLDGDPFYYLDTCLGTPVYADSDGPLVPPLVGDPAYLVGDLIALDGAFPDMSSLDGTQYGCWLNIRLKYGVDSSEPNSEVPPGGTLGTPDELRFEVDGYVQGDWRLRY